MTDQTNHVARVVVGAAVGASFAYLFLTANGRRVLDSMEPWLDDAIRNMQRLRAAAAKARTAIDEGRQSLNTVRKLSNFGGERQEFGGPEFRH